MNFANQEITNNAFPTDIANLDAGAGLAFYVGTIWRTVVTLGGLAFLLYLVWGGLEWLMAGEDKGKIESARSKITQSLMGLAILVGSFAVVTLVQNVLKINILESTFENNI